MATQPKLAPDEVRLSPALISRVLANVSDQWILVGGQALDFWMRRFGIRMRGSWVTNDADFIGDLRGAHELADVFRAKVIRPPEFAITALVAQVRIPAPGGKFGNVDVLHRLFTATGQPRKTLEFTRRVIANAIQVRMPGGTVLRVMEPFDLLESRLHSAVAFTSDDLKGEHVLTQLRWAIEVAKSAIFGMASGRGDSFARLGVKVQQVFRLARSSPGRRAWREFGIDLLEVIDADLLEAMAPQCGLQLGAVRVMQEQRDRERTRG